MFMQTNENVLISSDFNPFPAINRYICHIRFSQKMLL